MSESVEISLAASGSESETISSSEAVLAIKAPPRALTRAEIEWFDTIPKHIYATESGLSLTAPNSIETGVQKWYSSGTIFDKSGFYSQPGFLQSFLQQSGDVVSVELNESSVRRLPGSYLAATDRSSSKNFYHWMIEALIPILTMRDAGLDAPLLLTVDGELTRWQLETLNILGEVRVCALDWPEPPVLVDRLFWRRSKEVIGLSYKDIMRLRRAFDLTPKGPNRRLYIKRSMSGPRWLENSSDVEAALISLNFEVIVAESMTLTEQIEAFASAEIVVGLHGAGLTNIVFCRPGCAVVEIHPSDEIRNYFWLISEMINLRYHFLRGDGSMNLSIGVDTDRLLTLVRAAIRDL